MYVQFTRSNVSLQSAGSVSYPGELPRPRLLPSFTRLQAAQLLSLAAHPTRHSAQLDWTPLPLHSLHCEKRPRARLATTTASELLATLSGERSASLSSDERSITSSSTLRFTPKSDGSAACDGLHETTHHEPRPTVSMTAMLQPDPDNS